jgi:eukaryotic-like serine/threonine-protein kinase
MFEDEIGSKPAGLQIAEPYLFQVGEVIDGRYFVRAQLGNGGMGAVLEVIDPDDFSFDAAALKYCKRGQDRRRFAREVRVMENAKSAHVIPIVGSRLDHDPPYFVMPLALCSLESQMATLAKDEVAALEIFRQICVGVQDLHNRGIYHRDLKPANVLQLADGRIVVCDLGLARLENRDTTILTQAIGWLGTEAYLAPEQRHPAGSQNADARTDIYQLGKVLYQLITGKHPQSVDYSKLPRVLEYIVKRATAEDPADRYQTVEKLEDSLSAYRSSKDVSQNPREVLENLIIRLKSECTWAPPIAEDLIQVLETLGHCVRLDHRRLIDCFHLIPAAWFSAIAQDHEPLLNSILRAYTVAIHVAPARNNFELADEVASRMKAIYDNSSTVRTKVLALRNLMTSAERLNRYKPQQSFCTYLEGIKTVDLAIPVAEMISEYGKPDINEFCGYRIDLYHLAIQNALKALCAKSATDDRQSSLQTVAIADDSDDQGEIPF